MRPSTLSIRSNPLTAKPEPKKPHEPMNMLKRPIKEPPMVNIRNGEEPTDEQE